MMEPPAATKRYTPEDLLAMPNSHGFDHVDGQLVERNMGAESSWVSPVDQSPPWQLRRGRAAGLGDGSGLWLPNFSGRSQPRTFFRTALSFRHGRLPNDRPPRGRVRVAPDLVIEVISPNDLAWEIEAKVAERLRAGVPLIWVFYPDTHTVWIYRTSGDAARLDVHQMLSGEDVLPGFTCAVADLFPALS